MVCRIAILLLSCLAQVSLTNAIAASRQWSTATGPSAAKAELLQQGHLVLAQSQADGGRQYGEESGASEEAGSMPEGQRTSGSVLIEDAHGMFKGGARLIEALLQDLPEELRQDLANCSLALQGGGTFDGTGHPGRVWILVNGEMMSGEKFWEHYRKMLDPADKAVILGNWWNSSQESFRSAQVSSLWVPFASINFAERNLRSPMDLVDRGRRTRFNGQRHLVAYQQKRCAYCKGARDVFWDRLNGALGTMNSEQVGLWGHALSACNGKLDSGKRLELPKDGGYHNGTRYDWSVGRYEHFRFVWSAEHCANDHGYITEKIVDTFLAGAVPIYSGALPSQIGQVFKGGSFIQVGSDGSGSVEDIERVLGAMKDQDTYAALLHSAEPVVSDAAMRKFFTWHPDTWSTYGDGLRLNILKHALAKCHGELGPA